ncbi:phosphoribosyltransferase [Pseudooceanicola lipolyticus]|uniref:Phosphoribosyltransferase n=1 Tax=Pseudooceanicola lipolyticus TaxID=2029104 RepID=A0A2M8J0D7_9RHOB|nr:phosphoribosyltransferase [Pseudooceanicola lipolyticus]PJE36237.1 phosphoribosyltransferase [Pseudooceanicola lipolyticus]
MRLDVWQELYRNLTPGVQPDQQSFAVDLGGQQILLPIRVLPEGDRAVVSLILNQASFRVLDLIADVLAERLAPLAPDVVVAVPTLGLPLAEAVARRLGHSRLVPLGYSRKFWYDEALSLPLSSITTPGGGKRLYVDPHMLPLLKNRRVLVVDDVLSSGASMRTVLALLDRAGIRPMAVGAAMLQGERWVEAVPDRVIGAFATPILTRGCDGWQALD